MINLVIARYNEDVSWTKKINPRYKISLYNKFYKNENNYLPNVGREGHTYLHHIIENYDTLSEYTLFSQGNPMDHNREFIDIINDTDTLINLCDQNKGIYFLCPKAQESIYSTRCYQHPCGLPIYYFYDLLFDEKLNLFDKLDVFYGAIFLINKTNIINRSKDFYKFLINFLSYEKDPIEGYVFERLWNKIFDKQTIISNKYKMWELKV